MNNRLYKILIENYLKEKSSSFVEYLNHLNNMQENICNIKFNQKLSNDDLTKQLFIDNQSKSYYSNLISSLISNNKKIKNNILEKQSGNFDLKAFGTLAQKTNSSILKTQQKKEINFSAWGDSQGGWDTFILLTQLLRQPKYDFTIGLGDLTSNGCDASQWQKLAHALQPLSQFQQIFLVPGNHDYDGNYDELYAQHFMEFQNYHKQQNSYFTFSNDIAAFLVLDPNKNFPLAIDKSQEKWAVNVMESEAWKKARWRFVLCHQVAFGCGWPGYKGDKFLRDFFSAHAEKNKIDFVLSGHIHDYERVHKQYGSQTTTFLISGGAGGGLEPNENDITHSMEKVVKKHHFLDFKLTEQEVCIKTIDLNQNLLDSINIQK